MIAFTGANVYDEEIGNQRPRYRVNVCKSTQRRQPSRQKKVKRDWDGEENMGNKHASCLISHLPMRPCFLYNKHILQAHIKMKEMPIFTRKTPNPKQRKPKPAQAAI